MTVEDEETEDMLALKNQERHIRQTRGDLLKFAQNGYKTTIHHMTIFRSLGEDKNDRR